MKIVGSPVDAYLRTSLVGVGAPRRAQPVDKGGAEGAASSEAAHVTISAAARALVTGTDAPVDQAKVEMLKGKIADGSFRVEPETIAARLLDKIG